MTKERSGLIRLSMAFVEESDIGVYGLRVFNEHGKAYLFCLFIYLLLFIFHCCLLNNRWGLLWGCPCLRRPRGQSRSIFGRLLPRLRQVFRFWPTHAPAWQTFDRLDVRHPCHLDLETRPPLGTQLGTLLCGRDGWIPRWWLEWGRAGDIKNFLSPVFWFLRFNTIFEILMPQHIFDTLLFILSQ